jgi:predicted nucleic acid-binding protein
MNRATRFMDTGYWLAFVDRTDAHHARAMQLARAISPVRS